MIGNNLADNTGLLPEFILLDGGKNFGYMFGGDNCDELALVGHVEGIKSQKFADTGGFVLNGNLLFIDSNPDLGCSGDFIQCHAHAVLLQNYSEGMEMDFSGNFYAAIGNRSSMN